MKNDLGVDFSNSISFASNGGTQPHDKHSNVSQRGRQPGNVLLRAAVQVHVQLIPPDVCSVTLIGCQHSLRHQVRFSPGRNMVFDEGSTAPADKGVCCLSHLDLLSANTARGNHKAVITKHQHEKRSAPRVLACHTQVTGSTNTVRHTEQCKSTSALTMLGTKAVTPLTQPLLPPTHAAIRNSSSPTAFISAQCVNNYLSGVCLQTWDGE